MGVRLGRVAILSDNWIDVGLFLVYRVEHLTQKCRILHRKCTDFSTSPGETFSEREKSHA